MNILFVLSLLMFGILPADSTGETQLPCSFGTDYWELWPRYKLCEISKAKLSNRSEKFKFLGTASEFQEATSVRFYECSGTVERIPLELFSYFPNLNGLEIQDLKISNVTNELFSDSNFEKIQYLYLTGNKIEQIEEKAFQVMTNLKWIGLLSNKLTSIDTNLFKHNPKLEYISFRSNKINSVHPSLFTNLNNLKLLYFNSNVCFNGEVGCETCSPLTTDEINEKFESCYATYVNQRFPEQTEEIKLLKMEKEGLKEELKELKQKQEDQVRKSEDETKSMKEEMEKQMKDIKANFEAAIESIRIQSLATLKVLLAGLNYNEEEVKEIKEDLEKIPEGKTNMKTYQEAIKANFMEREEGMEKKMDGYLKEIVRDV